MKEYTPILIIIIFSFILCSIIILASYVLSIKRGYTEKIAVYECGFDPFGDSRQKFEVRFFLVGIIFIIFDLEISFLFP
jgi:NADH-quinone oxidoreductase subunit A